MKKRRKKKKTENKSKLKVGESKKKEFKEELNKIRVNFKKK